MVKTIVKEGPSPAETPKAYDPVDEAGAPVKKKYPRLYYKLHKKAYDMWASMVAASEGPILTFRDGSKWRQVYLDQTAKVPGLSGHSRSGTVSTLTAMKLYSAHFGTYNCGMVRIDLPDHIELIGVKHTLYPDESKGSTNA